MQLYLCLHTDHYRHEVPFAEGMLQTLIVQLLWGSDHGRSSLDFINRALLGSLENADIAALCALVDALVY